MQMESLKKVGERGISRVVIKSLVSEWQFPVIKIWILTSIVRFDGKGQRPDDSVQYIRICSTAT
jgi:hypothetical protein